MEISIRSLAHRQSWALCWTNWDWSMKVALTLAWMIHVTLPGLHWGCCRMGASCGSMNVYTLANYSLFPAQPLWKEPLRHTTPGAETKPKVQGLVLNLWLIIDVNHKFDSKDLSLFANISETANIHFLYILGASSMIFLDIICWLRQMSQSNLYRMF